jgi:putative NIF3 family GTP cyclohydrolase 1 type 2
VVAYRTYTLDLHPGLTHTDPIIFRGLKSLTLDDSQQNSLLRLAQAGVSVYCPHTAVDAAPSGLGDWLSDMVAACGEEASRSVVNTVTHVPGFEGAGYGRIVRFTDPVPLGDIAKAIRERLGGLSGLFIATPQSTAARQGSKIPISSFAVCAGSGGSMLNGLDVDLLFTGELSHHEALAVIERGKCVITAFHSNTERRFLRDVMAKSLHGLVAQELAPDAENFSVDVCDEDRDPFKIVDTRQLNYKTW